MIKELFGDRFSILVSVINELLNEKRLRVVGVSGPSQPSTIPGQPPVSTMSMVYQLINMELATKLRQLNSEEMHVYQVIEKSSNMGVWARDIKSQTNTQQQTLNKILKLIFIK